MTRVIGNDELPNNGSVHKFEGYLPGDVDVTFFLSDTASGKGPELHRHPYDEVFVVQEGELTSTVEGTPSGPQAARSWWFRPACRTSSSTPVPDEPDTSTSISAGE